ncbi:MAG: hypothetical protein WCB68_07635 [Pyrinomonadaceae bacterium]
MNTANNGRIQHAGKRKLQPAKASSVLNPAILPLEELRQLVFQIILRDSIEPFLRRMVILLDSLKEGKTEKVAQIARQSKDPAFTRLMSALSNAVQQGEVVAARITVFLAAGYAYQDTRDYFWDVMNYLDRFREDANKQT